jgi:hypothetical protein
MQILGNGIKQVFVKFEKRGPFLILSGRLDWFFYYSRRHDLRNSRITRNHDVANVRAITHRAESVDAMGLFKSSVKDVQTVMCDSVDFFSIAVQFDANHGGVERHIVCDGGATHRVAVVETVERQHDWHAFLYARFLCDAGNFRDFVGNVDGRIYIEIVLPLYRARLQIIQDETKLDDVGI